MMISTLDRRLVVFLATAACCFSAPVTAQDLLLNEVSADAGDSWIELFNRTSAPIDISTWSLHYASKTPGMPQNYWWPFPSGTVVDAGGYLRVHWLVPVPTSPTPGEVFTGTTPYGFLFGLGSEPLHGTRGALGLFRSQQNELMNTASMIEDWVSWGENGYAREPLAIGNGLWTGNRHAPAIPATQSLARNTAVVDSVTFPDDAWFLDETPTPSGPNVQGALVEQYGDACALPGNHLLGLPQLRAPSLPLIGNSQFGFAIDNTTGIYGEYLLLAFSAAAAPSGAPSILPHFPGSTCHEAIDVGQLVAVWILPTQLFSTNVPLPLSDLSTAVAGVELDVQSLVLDLLPFAYPPYQGMSNALRVIVGQ